MGNDTRNGTIVPFVAPGVVTMPPESVHQSIKAQVDAALAGVKAGRTMAILNVHTHKGVNLAVAHRFSDHFEVVAYVGKSGWDRPLDTSSVEGGVSVAYSR